MALSLRRLFKATSPELLSGAPAGIEAALEQIEAGLRELDVTALALTALRDEFGAMVDLYRAVRGADAFMQQALRSSEVGEHLLRVYYALRTTQAALSMRYAMEGRAEAPPETSPVGTAIGLFDAPKVLAQPTHLASGSYDAELGHFVVWMKDIWTDMSVRRADYLRFYGEGDVEAALASLHEILDLEANGTARHRYFAPRGDHDPAVLLDRLTHWAGPSADLIDAARAIQEASQQARSSLLALIAHRSAYERGLGNERVAEIEMNLMTVVSWPFPVGKTPLFDVAAEQDRFDDLLSRVVSVGANVPEAPDTVRASAEEVLRRACLVEQSLRDHASEYRARYSDGRARRSFRWYVWEFLGLLDRAGGQSSLGARGNGRP
jgi:hypothetical protein